MHVGFSPCHHSLAEIYNLSDFFSKLFSHAVKGVKIGASALRDFPSQPARTAERSRFAETSG
jgi:hypothetical protein